jgi:hypothetical protein
MRPGPRPAANASREPANAPDTGSDNIPATPATMLPSRLRPVFRALSPGELREVATFEEVQCPRGGVVLSVKTPERVARLSAKAFDKIEFLTYRQEAPGQVGCGRRDPPERVYVTYTSGGGLPGTDGVVVAIEMLPDDFKP